MASTNTLSTDNDDFRELLSKKNILNIGKPYTIGKQFQTLHISSWRDHYPEIGAMILNAQEVIGNHKHAVTLTVHRPIVGERQNVFINLHNDNGKALCYKFDIFFLFFELIFQTSIDRLEIVDQDETSTTYKVK